MFGFTRCERCLVIALPLVFLLSALLLLLSSTAWSIYGSPMATCFTPQEFTPEWNVYAMEVCSSRSAAHFVPKGSFNRVNKGPNVTDQLLGPSEWAAKVPLRLLLLATLLALPLMLGDVLGRAAQAAAPSKRPLTRVGAALRSVAMLLTRAAFLVCLAIALSKATMDAPTTDPDTNDDSSSALSLPNSPPTIALCELTIKKLGKDHNYMLLCHIRDGPHVGLAKTLLLFLWYALVLVVAWLVISSVELLLLLACPATRATALKDATRTAPAVDAEPKEESKL